MNGEKAFNFRRVGFGNRAAPARDAGIVHQDVNAAKSIHCRIDKALIVACGLNRSLYRQRPAPQGFDLGHGFAGCDFVTCVGQDNVRAIVRQANRDAAANAAPATGNDRDPII
jgi:hypothetical protein